MRRDEETADREVDLISSYFEKGMHPGLKMIFESLTAQHQQYRTYMYKRGFAAAGWRPPSASRMPVMIEDVIGKQRL